MDPVTVSVGIGLVLSILLAEAFGLAAGGMVVPGYLALFFNRPGLIVATLLAALLTHQLVRGLSHWMIVYGRRRTALMILTGFLIGAVMRSFAASYFAGTEGGLSSVASDFSVVGFIIPGLLAIWFDRQGICETVSVVTLASVAVRLTLIVFGVETIA